MKKMKKTTRRKRKNGAKWQAKQKTENVCASESRSLIGRMLHLGD